MVFFKRNSQVENRSDILSYIYDEKEIKTKEDAINSLEEINAYR